MAAAAFDTLAGTRPRIRRDVLFTETPGGVLFHNADGGFHLTGRTAYRFASLLVPHLTGRNSLADICAGFPDAQKSVAAGLLKALYERDFARDVPAGDQAPPSDGPETAAARHFATQIAYVDHYTGGAAERFRRFRTTRVAVLGGDAVARWCALSLLRNGCARVGVERSWDELAAEQHILDEAGCPARVDPLPGGRHRRDRWEELTDYDVVVVTGADAASRTHRLLSAGVPDGRTVIPAWTFGGHAVTGPLTTHDTTGCWHCALLRLGAAQDAGAAAGLWGELAGGAVPAAPGAEGPLHGPPAAMTGNLLGYEVFRLTTGALPAETDRQVLLQDLDSLDVLAEPVWPHPRCARCATGGRGAERAAQAEAETAQVRAEGPALARTATVETAREAERTVDELNALGTALVRPHTGVFTRYDDEELTQTPLKASRVEVPLGPGVRRWIAAFDVHHMAGARVRALHAAAVVYVEHVVPPQPDTPTPLDGTHDPADHTDGAGTDDAGTDAAPRGVGGGSGAGVTVPATSLLTGEAVRLPAAAVHRFGPYNHGRDYPATRAGAGAGATPREAAGSGLLSALAHDALLRAVRGTTTVSLVADPARPAAADDSTGTDSTGTDSTGTDTAGVDSAGAEGAPDPELEFLRRTAVNLGVTAELLDLGEQERSSARVVLAREVTDGQVTDGEHGAGGEAPRWAVAADLSGTAAACAALRDLLGQVQLATEDGAGGPGAVDTGDPVLFDLHPGALAVTGPVTAPGDDGEATDWERILERLRAAGRDVLLVPTTPQDLRAGGISTARVLLTGGPEDGPDAGV